MQNILLVEDNKGDREHIRLMLASSKDKYKLFFAGSLAECRMELAETDGIDLVLLDLGLPDSGGFQTLLRYLEYSPSVPVIVMTGLKQQQIGTKAVRAGAQDFLVKDDFDKSQLLKSIRYALERFRHQAAAEQLADTYSTEGDRLRELYRLASLGDWEMDVVSNEMTWSEELFQIFEETPYSFKPTFTDYLKYVIQDDQSKVKSFITEAMEKEESGPLEYWVLIDNRKQKRLSVRTKIRFDDKSNKVLLMGTVQNLSSGEEESFVKQPEPDKKAKKKEKGGYELDPNVIINQISFNIRTPLSTIINLLYLMEQTALSARQSEYISDLKTAFDDLTFTLSNLVNLSILSNDDLPLAKEFYRPVDMLESIQRVMSFKASQNNRELDMYIDSRLAFMVQGDSNVLGQLFFCLMELAFLHSIEESFLKLRCTLDESEDKTEKLVVQLEYSGVVPDWPNNMDYAETLSPMEILKPESLNKQRDQLLALVFLRLCRQLKVVYQLNAQKGGVYLDMEVPLQRKDRDGEFPSEPTKPLKILLVEDHPMHQIATKQILSNWSEKVTAVVAGDGKIALAKLQEEDFDIILMDLQMPVMDGMTATAQIRMSNPVPIIALTASTSKQEEERCYDVGMNDYLAKPFQPNDLQRRIIKLTH